MRHNKMKEIRVKVQNVCTDHNLRPEVHVANYVCNWEHGYTWKYDRSKLARELRPLVTETAGDDNHRRIVEMNDSAMRIVQHLVAQGHKPVYENENELSKTYVFEINSK